MKGTYLLKCTKKSLDFCDSTRKIFRIMNQFEEIARKSSENPDSTKTLVELNHFINDSKTIVLFSSKKDLAKSAEYMEFLLSYANVSGIENFKWHTKPRCNVTENNSSADNVIGINTKIFRWPKNLEEILTLAESRVSHKIEIVENTLREKRTKFSST